MNLIESVKYYFNFYPWFRIIYTSNELAWIWIKIKLMTNLSFESHSLGILVYLIDISKKRYE